MIIICEIIKKNSDYIKKIGEKTLKELEINNFFT